ncbi:hypothetical protein JXQ31_15680 [candidate division KSB1 bacterium]|nr:hypothetical protein [candidate division KSB1 bacterium]
MIPEQDVENCDEQRVEQVTLPVELVEDTLDLLLNPKRIISSSNEIVLDWNKRTQVYDRLYKVVKKAINF